MHCFTVIIKVETYHIADRGESENVHRLSREQLEKRNVVHIDIANDPVSLYDTANLRIACLLLAVNCK